MQPFTSKELKLQARDRLRTTGSNVRQIILIYSGILVLLTLISNGLNLYLNSQISSTGGLSGLSTRSMLQTFQTMIRYATSLFTPFWSAGFVRVAMLWAANEDAVPNDLLGGFRRWGAIVGYLFRFTLMMIFLILGTAYLASTIFALTPYSQPFVDLVVPLVESGSMDFSLLPQDQLLAAYTPFLVIWSILFLPIFIFLQYTLRFTLYVIINHPKIRGTQAMAVSAAILRGNKMRLFKLDLSFWWYYGLEFLLAIVCYLDSILPMLGISFPFNETVAYFLFLALYCILQLLLEVWKMPEVSTTYALAYRQMSNRDQVESAQSE